MIDNPMTTDSSSGFSSDFSRREPDGPVEQQFVEANVCGSGAASTVYRVRTDGVLVAVKRLSAELRLNAAHIASYRKEFELGRRLRHDALPVYLELRADDREVYIVMDFIDGLSLERMLASTEGKAYFRKEENLRRFLEQLLDAMAYLHRSGVIHCDLKPANIMVRHSDRAAMIIDLDKAYCDTHDLTHGGSPGISDALTDKQKPTAAKDFAAIGSVLDIILSSCGIPASKFRRFRKLCSSPEVTADMLRDAIRRKKSPSRWIAAGVIALLLLIVAVVVGIRLNRAEIDTPTTPAPVAPATATPADVAPADVAPQTDTISPLPKDSDATPTLPTTPNPLPATTQKHRPETVDAPTDPDVEIDFDNRMSKYTQLTAEARAALRSGKVGTPEFQELLSRRHQEYQSTFNQMVEDYKKRHPAATHFDAYEAVTRALGNSRVFQQEQTFGKELLDSVNAATARIK